MAELYDLKADPGENKNLVKDPAYARNIQHLRLELDRLIKEHGNGKPDQMPIDQGIQSGLPEESIR